MLPSPPPAPPTPVSPGFCRWTGQGPAGARGTSPRRPAFPAGPLWRRTGPPPGRCSGRTAARGCLKGCGRDGGAGLSSPPPVWRAGLAAQCCGICSHAAAPSDASGRTCRQLCPSPAEELCCCPEKVLRPRQQGRVYRHQTRRPGQLGAKELPVADDIRAGVLCCGDDAHGGPSLRHGPLRGGVSSEPPTSRCHDRGRHLNEQNGPGASEGLRPDAGAALRGLHGELRQRRGLLPLLLLRGEGLRPHRARGHLRARLPTHRGSFAVRNPAASEENQTGEEDPDLVQEIAFYLCPSPSLPHRAPARTVRTRNLCSHEPSIKLYPGQILLSLICPCCGKGLHSFKSCAKKAGVGFDEEVGWSLL